MATAQAQLISPAMMGKVKEYIRTKKILILDHSGSTRSQLTKMMTDMGATRNYIHSCSSADEAQKLIRNEKISLIFSEFEIENQACLPLFSGLIEKTLEIDRLLVLVTKNSQQTAVAEAMEGQVDAYIIKPFVLNYIKDKVARTILSKISPTPVQKKLQEAEELLLKKSFYLAEPLLIDLLKLKDVPAKAVYLYGNLFLARADQLKAKSFFEKALKIQKGHFKSLNAVYDICQSEGKDEEALAYLLQIKDMLPLSQKKLKDLFVLYSNTGNSIKLFDLLDEYKEMDNKSDDFVSTVGKCLVKAGKLFVKEDRLDLAHESFYAALGYTGFELSVISNVCDFLVSENQIKLAEFLLSKTKAEERGSPEFMALEFRVSMLTAGEDYVITRGRDLMKANAADPRVYFEYIKVNLKNQKMMPAEQGLADAKRKFPEETELWDSIQASIEARNFLIQFPDKEPEILVS